MIEVCLVGAGFPRPISIAQAFVLVGGDAFIVPIPLLRSDLRADVGIRPYEQNSMFLRRERPMCRFVIKSIATPCRMKRQYQNTAYSANTSSVRRHLRQPLREGRPLPYEQNSMFLRRERPMCRSVIKSIAKSCRMRRQYQNTAYSANTSSVRRHLRQPLREGRPLPYEKTFNCAL